MKKIGSKIKYYDPDNGSIVRSKINDIWESQDNDRDGKMLCSTELHPDRWLYLDMVEEVA